ncbi:MAG: LysM peptidoglycan-binding domain-containing protein [Kiritimatiellae bacterium]|jgi:LysM repeat protein|nr:LysM peptidoglycan-binding domain-containing protein [Kiritimatiellia bacterium]
MRLHYFVFAGFTVLFVSGCSSPLFEGSIFDQRGNERNKNDLAQIKITSEMTNIECQRLSEQIDALNRNQQLIDNRLRNIESQLSSGNQTQKEVAVLRREIESVRSNREQLRSQITEDLATKIEKVAAKQQRAIQNSQRPVASSTAGSPSAASGSGYEHKVERGQTLSEIARGYNTTVSKIIKANNIKNAANIRVGQTLFIPD